MGGHYGGNDLVICSTCAKLDAPETIGIVLGDAVLDFYKNQARHHHQLEDLTTVVNSITNRIKQSMYTAVAQGFCDRTYTKPYCGLRDDS
jgi:hypothetical protein